MQVIAGCVGAAGFSVGEYAALVFSQAMTLEDGECVCVCVYMFMWLAVCCVFTSFCVHLSHPNAREYTLCMNQRLTFPGRPKACKDAGDRHSGLLMSCPVPVLIGLSCWASSQVVD